MIVYISYSTYYLCGTMSKRSLPSEVSSKRPTSFDSLKVAIETARNLVGVQGSEPAQVALLNLASELINSKSLDKPASTQARDCLTSAPKRAEVGSDLTQAGGGLAAQLPTAEPTCSALASAPAQAGGGPARVLDKVNPTMSVMDIERRVRKLFTDFVPTGPKAMLYGLVYMTFYTTNKGLPQNVKHDGMMFRFLHDGKLLVLVRCKLGAVETLMQYISSLLSCEFQINSVEGSPGLQGDVHIPFKEVETCLGPNLAKCGFRMRNLTLRSSVFTNGKSSILVSGMDNTITRVCVVTNGMLENPVVVLKSEWDSVWAVLRDRAKACAAPQYTEHQCTHECMGDPMTPPASEEEESACSMAAQALTLMADPLRVSSNMQAVD